MSYTIPPESKKRRLGTNFIPSNEIHDFLSDIENITYVESYAEGHKSTLDNQYGYLQRDMVFAMKGGGEVILSNVELAIPNDNEFNPELSYAREAEALSSEAFHIRVSGHERGVSGIIPNHTDGNALDLELDADNISYEWGDKTSEIVQDLREVYLEGLAHEPHVKNILPKLEGNDNQHKLITGQPVLKTKYKVSLDEVAKSVEQYLSDVRLAKITPNTNDVVISVNDSGLVQTSSVDNNNPVIISKTNIESFDAVDVKDSEALINHMAQQGIGLSYDNKGQVVVTPERLARDNATIETTLDSQRNTYWSTVTAKIAHDFTVLELSSSKEDSIKAYADLEASDYKAFNSKDSLIDYVQKNDFQDKKAVVLVSGEFDTPQNAEDLKQFLTDKKVEELNRGLRPSSISVLSNEECITPSFTDYADHFRQLAVESASNIKEDASKKADLNETVKRQHSSSPRPR